MSIYTENGYASREEYLNLLREDYGEQLVNTFIPRYQPSEDFGGLIHAITEEYYYNQYNTNSEPEFVFLDEDDEEYEEDEDD
jgi:hypothetical protein